MARVRLFIDDVDRTAWLAHGYTFDIEKVQSLETCHLSILDLDSTAGAYRPTVGQTIRLTRWDDEEESDVELLYGGEINIVVDEPIIDDTGTVTKIRALDWMALADRVFMPTRTYASATAHEVFTAIVEEYLGPKGVTLNTPDTGGPVLPELRIEDHVTTVRQTLDRITGQIGWPWRINGDKVCGLVEPGSIVGPVPLADDGQSVLTDPPLRWEQQSEQAVTRVFLQTAVPEFGPGPVEWTEEVVGDGVLAVMHAHVLPTGADASTTAAAETLDTTLVLTGLPPTLTLRLGARLTIEWHTQVYSLAAAATADSEGNATVTLNAGVERDVPESHRVTFLPDAYEQLEIDGVVEPLDGTPYVWDPVQQSIVYPGGAFPVGAVITRRTWITMPTVIREWDASAVTAIGHFDYSVVVDTQLTDEEGHTDLTAARAYAQEQLAIRLTPAKKVTCTTQIPGHYPWLTVDLDFPDRLVTGTYLITETRIRHTVIDENADGAQPLFYELTLWEGDAIGSNWVQFFRGRNPSLGLRWGPVVLPDPEPTVLTRMQGTGKVKTTGTSIALTFATPPVVGRGLLVGVFSSSAGTFTSAHCTDNQGNTWVLAKTENAIVGSANCAIFYCSAVAATGAPFTITLAPGFGTRTFVAAAMEYGGVGSGLALDTVSSAAGLSASSSNAGASTIRTDADEIHIGVTAIADTQASLTVTGLSPASPATLEEAEELTTTTGEIATRILSATTPSATIGWAYTPTNAWYAGVQATFKKT